MENPDRLVKAVNLKNESKNKWYASDTAKAPAVRYAHQNTIRFEHGPMLLAAVAAQDLEETQRLIREGTCVNFANAEGLTPLHQACIDENFELVRVLVDAGADLNACDNEGWTALHAAASRGIPLEIVRYLVLKGGNPAAVNADGELPLDLADNDQIAKYFEDELEKRGIDIDEAREVEEKLLQADVDKWKKTGKYEEIRDCQGATPLHVAASKGYTSIAKTLLSMGANPNAQDDEGWTPLHAAVNWKNEDIITDLVKAGGKLFLTNNSGQSPFSMAEKEIKPLIQNLAQKYNQKQDNEVPKKIPLKDLKVQGILKTSKSESDSSSKIPKPIQKPPAAAKIPMPSRAKEETPTKLKEEEPEKPAAKSIATPPARPGTGISRPSPRAEPESKSDITPTKETRAEIPTPSMSSVSRPPTSTSSISKPPTPTSISKPPTPSTSSIPKPSSPSTPSSSTISKPPSSSISKPPSSTTSSVSRPPTSTTSEIPKPGASRPPAVQTSTDSSSESDSVTEIRDLKTKILLLEGEVSSLKKERENLLKIIDNLRAENDKNKSNKTSPSSPSSSIARPPTKK